MGEALFTASRSNARDDERHWQPPPNSGVSFGSRLPVIAIGPRAVPGALNVPHKRRLALAEAGLASRGMMYSRNATPIP